MNSPFEPLSDITDPLLAWYHAHARILPWRQSIDPYRVWVSEIMLQQTRVEAVIPYFNRFLAALPNVYALAQASEDQLFKLWEGLGYYSRVRNMKKAAGILCSSFDGVFPDSADALSALPGIGEYTAGAIASIAFDKPAPAVDGNVLRVVSRLCTLNGDVTKNPLRKAIGEALQKIYPLPHGVALHGVKIYPAGSNRDFTQALMELGAIVCLPNGQPLCEKCPLRNGCRAQIGGTTADYPAKKEKKERRREDKTVLLLRCGHRVALCRREEKGVLSGMWQFPNLKGALTEDQVQNYFDQRGISIVRIRPGPSAVHIFTHLEWHMVSFYADCRQEVGENTEYEFVTMDELSDTIALPTAFRAFQKALVKQFSLLED